MHTLRVLSLFLEDVSTERYGLEIARALDLHSGTLYPLLGRLERAGWLESRFESVDPQQVGRPRRRLYGLTGAGEVAARAAISDHLKRAQALERRSGAPYRRPELGPA